MTDPTPIQQRIDILANTQGAGEVSAALDKLKGQYEDEARQAELSARAAQRKEQQASRLADRLRTLTTSQAAYEKQARDGVQLDDKAVEVAKRRELQTDRLSRAIAREEDRQADVNRRMREAVETHRQFDDSGQKVQRRTDGMSSDMQLLGGRLGVAAGGFSLLAGSMVAGKGIEALMRGVEKATEDANERLEENIRLTNEAARATLNLHGLNLTFDQGNEELVTAFSNASGRDFAESAGLLTQFRSSTAALSREEQDKLFIEGLLPLAIATDGDLGPAAKFFGRISSLADDPTEIKNIIGLGVQLAGESDPSQFLDNAGELLVPGADAGLQPAETLSLLSYASGKIETSAARTQLRNILTRFQSDPDTQEKLAALGVPEGAGFYEQLEALSETDFGAEQAVDLVGVENSTILSALVSEYDTVESFRDQTVAAAGEGDLYGEFIQDLNDRSPRHRQALEDARLEQIRLNERRNDTDAQTIGRARKAVDIILDREVRAGRLSASAKKSRLEQFDSYTASPTFRAHVRGDLFAGRIDAAPGQDISGWIRDFPLEDLTADQIAESAASVIERNGFLTDVLPGGDSSTEVEISDYVRDTLRRRGEGNILDPDRDTLPPQSAAPQILNLGTLIINAGDPLFDDLNGRDRIG